MEGSARVNKREWWRRHLSSEELASLPVEPRAEQPAFTVPRDAPLGLGPNDKVTIYWGQPRVEQTPSTDPTGEQAWSAARLGQPDRNGQLPGDEFYQEEGSMDSTATEEMQAMREMTPNEIRYDEVAQLLDFVQGDPIDGSPSKKAIIAGLKFRLGELTPQSAEATAEQPSEAESPDQWLRNAVDELADISEKARRSSADITRKAAIDAGLALLQMDEERPPSERLVSWEWRGRLADTIAINLIGLIAAE